MAFPLTFHTISLTIVVFLVASCNGARDLSLLITRLQNNGEGPSECWKALGNIRSCSNEIIGFFLNGEAHIDKPCCITIVAIAENCWPALLGSVGYSPEEISFLEGYCQKAAFDTSSDLTPNGSPSPMVHLL